MDFLSEYFKANGTQVHRTEFGFIAYAFRTPIECFIDAIFVHPDWRGKGASTELLAHVLDAAKAQGSSWVATGIQPGQKGSNFVLHTLLHHDFELVGWSSELRMIIFKRGLHSCLS